MDSEAVGWVEEGGWAEVGSGEADWAAGGSEAAAGWEEADSAGAVGSAEEG